MTTKEEVFADDAHVARWHEVHIFEQNGRANVAVWLDEAQFDVSFLRTNASIGYDARDRRSNVSD